MTENASKYLLLSQHTSYYAFELSQTAEVEDPPELWPIPNSRPPCCGAMNFHNSIVAVLDLAQTLALPVSVPDKVIVLAPNVAALAFLVERVVRIVTLDQPAIAASTDKPFVRATFSIPEGDVSVLDLDALIRIATDAVCNKPDGADLP